MKINKRLIIMEKDEDLKINLGCDRLKLPGFVNIDINEDVNPEIVADLEKGIPLRDNTVTMVYANQFLEHITDPGFIFKEIERVLMTHCHAEIVVPHYRNRRAYFYQHKSFFRYNDIYDLTDMEVESIKLDFNSKILTKLVNISPKMQFLWENTFLSLIFPPKDIIWTVSKNKV